MALFEAFNAHDLDAVLALYHPDVAKVSPESPNPKYGKEVIRANYANLFERLPGVHDTVHRIISEESHAAVAFTASWSELGEDEKSVQQTLKMAAFLEIEDGLIVEDVTYYDRLASAAQAMSSR